MVGAAKQRERDRSMEFRGFLNDLKGWDSMSKERDQKSTNARKVQENKEPLRKMPTEAKPKVVVSPRDRSEQYTNLKYFDPLTNLPGASSTEDSMPNAASEKELGNEYFKQKKFHEAIECYSRSIILSPTSVAFANRAMAYLKLKRFEEAETDCTEALNLDDRYVKAYSRRATARKELEKFKEAMEDADFAVRLEPNNPELRKQYTEIKEVYEKEIAKRRSGAGTLKTSIQESQTAGVSKVSEDVKINYSITSNIQKTATAASKSGITKHNGSVRKHDAGASVQDLASRAASLVASAATKSIIAPKSAYEFEVSWRSLCDDHSLQTQMLKMIPPNTLPQIFKNALSAPILIDIIKCASRFIKEDIESAVSILDNMTKVPRFNMIIMCLSDMDRAEVKRIWEVVFLSEDIPINYRETLSHLQPKYCVRVLQDHIFESNWTAQ